MASSKQDPLAGLFGNNLRAKVLRVFLQNIKLVYTIDEIYGVIRGSKAGVKKEIMSLVKANILKGKKITETITLKSGKKKKKIHQGYIIDDTYPHIDIISKLFLNTFPIRGREVSRAIQSVGEVKAIVLSGVFVGGVKTPADILIIGLDINIDKLKKVLLDIEKSLGREIKYAIFNPNEFAYRLSIQDKLIRDILDYQHRILLDKMRLLSR
ncbi:MAG: hypothetical protein OXU73_02860 [Candidatus Campbellbacteria bacterium]|nr:hypothetical protein [Candidatus Campbellbacteria bacterium]